VFEITYLATTLVEQLGVEFTQHKTGSSLSEFQWQNYFRKLPNVLTELCSV